MGEEHKNLDFRFYDSIVQDFQFTFESLDSNNYPEILVIESNKDTADVIKFNLEPDNYKVVLTNTYQAISIIDSIKPPSAVLVDYCQPFLRSQQIIKHIRSKSAWFAVPIIVMKSRSDLEEITDILALGADDYVYKPIDIKLVISKLKAFLNCKSLRKTA